MSKALSPALVLVALVATGCATLEPELLVPPPPIAGSWPLPESTVPLETGTAAGQGATAPDQIEDILALSFPDIEPDLRAALARTLAAAIKDEAGA